MAWLKIQITDLFWMFMDDSFAFWIILWVLRLIVYKLASAHFENFHGIEEGTGSPETLEVEKALSIDEVVFIEILRVEFFVDLDEVVRSGWEFGLFVVFLMVVPIESEFVMIVDVLKFQKGLDCVSFLVDGLRILHGE